MIPYWIMMTIGLAIILWVRIDPEAPEDVLLVAFSLLGVSAAGILLKTAESR